MTDAPTICPTLSYTDAKAAIRQLTEGFGFTENAVYESEDGKIVHAELGFGNGVVMLGSRGQGGVFESALRDSGPVGIYVQVPDVDAHHKHTMEHGIEVLMPPTDQDYGSRDYIARDLEGNVWGFGTYAPGGASS
ncbi:VOC family protein [Streptomyces sp. NPDC002851]